MQRWLITAGVVLVLAALGALVYTYERHYRGPGESAFYGTWLDPTHMWDDPTYFEFRPDHTFTLWVARGGEKTSIAEGRWYAGGPNIYLRFPAEYAGPSRPIILHIVDISPQQFTVRFSREGGRVYRFERATLDVPRASNQAMERTATRRALTLRVAWTPSLPSTRARGGRRSSYSR